MDCKNCNGILEDNALFCDNCGARVIKTRITFKFLINELLVVLGFESIYFKTLKKMFLAPHEVLLEYLAGVRKKYANPFAFLAVGAAFSLLVFNYFSEDFMASNKAINQVQNADLHMLAKADSIYFAQFKGKELQQKKIEQKVAIKQIEYQDNWMRFMLNYFNLLTFIFLPLYTLISKLTYRKPHNFGEHIILNAYMQGATMYITSVAFLLGIIFKTPALYVYSMVLIVLYYLFTFAKLYQLNVLKSFIKLLKFIGVILVLALIATIVVFFISYFLGKFGFIKL